MTEVQETRILELRLKGLGYRRIATEAGLSRDIVRNYCRSKGMAGYATALEKNVSEQISRGKACLYCGKEIEQPASGHPKKFCSETCRRRWWRAHPEISEQKDTALYKMTCAHCGREFVSYGNRKRKYCRHNCYIRERFWRGEESVNDMCHRHKCAALILKRENKPAGECGWMIRRS